MSAANSATRPWQWEWKQPQWQAIAATTEATIIMGTRIDHAAARVHPNEVVAVYGANDARTNQSSSTSADAFVMTVSLLQQQQNAVVLCINLTRHENDSNEDNKNHAVVTSRVLTWPSSSFPQQQQADEVSWPWQSWFRNNNNNKSTTSTSKTKNGIMAVCLCRWSPPHPHEEALDLLNGLALVPSSSLQDANLHDDDTNTKETGTTKELVLFCLTHQGTVYMYNPWHLLLSTTIPTTSPPSHDSILYDSMVSFLLGDTLLQTLQQSMFPLSRPMRTWSIWNHSNRNSRQMDTSMHSSSTHKKSQTRILHSAVVVFETLMCVWGAYQSFDDDTNDDNSPITPSSRTGFVGFASLRTWTELRTVTLEFVPLRVTPLCWNAKEWVMVVGATQAVLIRTDASSSSTTIVPESNANPENNNVRIDRFQILPIDFSGVPVDTATTTTTSIVAWGRRSRNEDPVVAICTVKGGSSMVRIWTRTLANIIIRPFSAENGESQYAVTTRETRASLTEFPLLASETTLSATSSSHVPPRFHMGPGWILVVTGSVGVYLVCLEGATSNHGAYVQRLSTPQELLDSSSEGIHVSDIAGLDTEDDDENNEAFDLGFPLAHHDFSTFGKEWQEENGRSFSSPSSWNDTILNALENISSKSSSANKANDQSSSSTNTIISSKEKIQRLLRHCSSWKQLDESNTSRKRYFEQQLPCVSVGSRFMVTFRKCSMVPQSRVPFQSVLSWLSSKEDYFTAASLALSLLQDVRTLRYLWQCFDKTEKDDDVSTLEGLLDGILPLSNDKGNVVGSKDGGSTLSQLADMAIGCLIKGGIQMSATLTLLLATNQNYDPSRICLMLAAVTSTSCSAWNSERKDTLQKSDMEQVLWPVRALLEVGNARDCLWTAMLLLNAIIPDELRCRNSADVDTSAIPSIELCQALVRLVVTSSDAATQMLFNLVDEQSQRYFWDSLNDSTKQELALIHVGGKCPMLRQLQVRSWAASHLLSMVEEQAPTAPFPIEWLKRLATSCLSNAECTLSLQQQVVLPPEGQKVDPFKRYKQHVSHLRTSLVAAPNSGGLDFDLLIPCLLLLRTKHEPLFSTSSYSTQSILNAACYLAGRRNAEVPLFQMNPVNLMRKCFLTENVLAGAHLIGGKDGLVLQCCHVLMDCLDGISMTEAEHFLLAPAPSPPLSLEKHSPQSSPSSKMELSESHCLLLFLLEELVLAIRKYGDFDSTHSREKVDPAFAARTILRTWWCCTSSSTALCSEWLMEWLDCALRLGMNDRTTKSPYRLACAALIRALLWSEEGVPTLATRLQFSNDFLVRLSLSCCGLVEALPASVMEQSWKQHPPYASSSPNGKTKRSDSPPCSPITTPSRIHSDGMDDSFQSAVSSLDMM